MAAWVVGFVLSGCSGITHALEPGFLSAAQYGEAWPLTVDWGIVRCEGESTLVFRAPDGRDYELGLIETAAGYPPITPIWRETGNPNSPRVGLGPVIEAGQKLCP